MLRAGDGPGGGGGVLDTEEVVSDTVRSRIAGDNADKPLGLRNGKDGTGREGVEGAELVETIVLERGGGGGGARPPPGGGGTLRAGKAGAEVSRRGGVAARAERGKPPDLHR